MSFRRAFSIATSHQYPSLRNILSSSPSTPSGSLIASIVSPWNGMETTRWAWQIRLGHQIDSSSKRTSIAILDLRRMPPARQTAGRGGWRGFHDELRAEDDNLSANFIQRHVLRCSDSHRHPSQTVHPVLDRLKIEHLGLTRREISHRIA